MTGHNLESRLEVLRNGGIIYVQSKKNCSLKLCRAPDNLGTSAGRNYRKTCHLFSLRIYVVGTHWNHHIDAVLTCTCTV